MTYTPRPTQTPTAAQSTPAPQTTPTPSATTTSPPVDLSDVAWIATHTVFAGDSEFMDSAAQAQSELGWYQSHTVVGDEVQIATDDGIFVLDNNYAVVDIVACVLADCENTQEYSRSTYSPVELLSVLPPGSAIYISPTAPVLTVFLDISD